VSKKTAWYSMLRPLIFALVVLTIGLYLSGDWSPPVFIVLVAAVLVGSVLGAITVAWYEKRKSGS
jgi:uncharacterized membrane protein YfcA